MRLLKYLAAGSFLALMVGAVLILAILGIVLLFLPAVDFIFNQLRSYVGEGWAIIGMILILCPIPGSILGGLVYLDEVVKEQEAAALREEAELAAPAE